MNVNAKLIPTPKRLARILGGTLEAVQTRAGKTLVNLRRLCDSVGVDYDSEYARLVSPDCGWATVIEMTVRVVNQNRELTMIALNVVPMWLASIDPETVKPSARRGLVQFQREANAVMGAWFDGLHKERLKEITELASAVLIPAPEAEPLPHETAVSICPDGWRLARTTEMLASLVRHSGVSEPVEIRSLVLASLREAIEGGGTTRENIVTGEDLVDLPGVFRIALCSTGRPTDYEAETATAVVQRTLDRFLKSENPCDRAYVS